MSFTLDDLVHIKLRTDNKIGGCFLIRATNLGAAVINARTGLNVRFNEALQPQYILAGMTTEIRETIKTEKNRKELSVLENPYKESVMRHLREKFPDLESFCTAVQSYKDYYPTTPFRSRPLLPEGVLSRNEMRRRRGAAKAAAATAMAVPTAASASASAAVAATASAPLIMTVITTSAPLAAPPAEREIRTPAYHPVSTSHDYWPVAVGPLTIHVPLPTTMVELVPVSLALFESQP